MTWHEEGSEWNCELCGGLCTIANGKKIHLIGKCTQKKTVNKKPGGLVAFSDSLKYKTRFSMIGEPIKVAYREEFGKYMSDDIYHQYINMGKWIKENQSPMSDYYMIQKPVDFRNVKA